MSAVKRARREVAITKAEYARRLQNIINLPDDMPMAAQEAVQDACQLAKRKYERAVEDLQAASVTVH